MNEDSDSGPAPSARLSILRGLVAIGDRYESEWRSGRKPAIESYVRAAPEAERTTVLRLLLELDVELRRNQGECPRAEDYCLNLVEWGQVIEEVFHATSGRGAAGTGDELTSKVHVDEDPDGVETDRRDSQPPVSTLRDDPPVGTTAPIERTDAGSRFRWIRVLDRGGLGLVHVADDRELNREVALKEMRPELMDDPESLDRFVREAVITGQLEHPGIVPVYGLGYHADGRPYYAMRLIRTTDECGSSVTVRLDDEIRRLHRVIAEKSSYTDCAFELRRLLQAFVRICQTVAYAHSRQVIHRDLKPRNVLLGPHGEVLVVDWGLARIMGAKGGRSTAPASAQAPPKLPEQLATTVTRAGDVVGTLAYMPPEQAAGEVQLLRPYSDVYSLGATLYEILTDRPPFRREGRDLETLRREVIQGKFSPPRQVRRGVPAALEAICLKAMNQEPEGRYPSALALAEDVERWLADEPVLAHRDPLATRLGRWARRRKTLLAGLSTLLVAGMIGQAVNSWQVARERDRANRSFDLAEGALNDILDLVATRLGYVEGSAKIRQEAATKASEAYDHLVALRPRDPRVLLAASDAFRKLGNVYRMTGNDHEADRFYTRASELIAGLPAEDASQESRVIAQSKSLLATAEAHRLGGHLRQAYAEFEYALSLVAPFRRWYSRAYRLVSAEARLDMSTIHLENGDLVRTRDLSERAIEALESLGANRDLSEEKLLLFARTNDALAQRDLGDLAPAIEAFGAILDRTAELQADVRKREASPDPDLLFLTAVLEEERAEAQARTSERGAHGQAEPGFKAAIDSLERFVAKNPASLFYRRELGVTLYRRGALRTGEGKLPEARADCLRAVDLLDRLNREKPGIPDFIGQLARARLEVARIARKSGNPGEADWLTNKARTELAEAQRLNPDNQLDRRLTEQLGQ
jgi:serine/threonine-protein kinase